MTINSKSAKWPSSDRNILTRNSIDESLYIISPPSFFSFIRCIGVQ